MQWEVSSVILSIDIGTVEDQVFRKPTEAANGRKVQRLPAVRSNSINIYLARNHQTNSMFIHYRLVHETEEDLLQRMVAGKQLSATRK